MFARITTLQGSPASVDPGIQFVNEKIIPMLGELAGFKHAFFMADRGAGKMITLSLWETEEEMNASDAAVQQLRQDAEAATEGQIVSFERLEVFAEA